jgi:hypothetical protein
VANKTAPSANEGAPFFFWNLKTLPAEVFWRTLYYMQRDQCRHGQN